MDTNTNQIKFSSNNYYGNPRITIFPPFPVHVCFLGHKLYVREYFLKAKMPWGLDIDLATKKHNDNSESLRLISEK